MKWAYGITTVPSRAESTLPWTIRSLKAAGFDRPVLFVDGTPEAGVYDRWGLDTTIRSTPARTSGNWSLALLELYVKEPTADRYAVFQDDVVMCSNARQYLEEYRLDGKDDRQYWNLYSFPTNEALKPSDLSHGFYPSNQDGKGALALVFDRWTALKLITSEYLMHRHMDVGKGHQNLDGGVFVALKNLEFTEMVHYPSITQHIGKVSTMNHPEYPRPSSYPGESFDCLSLGVGSQPCSSATELPPLSRRSVSLTNLCQRGLVVPVDAEPVRIG